LKVYVARGRTDDQMWDILQKIQI